MISNWHREQPNSLSYLQKSDKSHTLQEVAQMSDTDKWHPPVHNSHLGADEQRVVREILYDQCDIFTKGDPDIGWIADIQQRINLKDETPIQKHYNTIPKPLFQEVK